MIFTVSYGAYLPNAIDRGTAFQFSENLRATPVVEEVPVTPVFCGGISLTCGGIN